MRLEEAYDVAYMNYLGVLAIDLMCNKFFVILVDILSKTFIELDCENLQHDKSRFTSIK